MEEPAKYFKHFSHEHPLEYVNLPHFDGNRVCSACKLSITPNNFFYQCRLCQFSIHKVCYTMPKKVVHPADPDHYLNLLTSSITDQSNDCKACGMHINGFYYNCTKCSLYCHMLCVALPLSVKIPSSHPHILKLELTPPYDFRCDLCDGPSYSGWLYRCRLCEFDAHVSCSVKGTQSPYQRSAEDDKLRDSKSHQHELMELLSQVMKGIEVKNVKNLDHDQSIPVSEDFTLYSYQFSDACFSIDITNSTPVVENRNQASKHQDRLPGSNETQKSEKLEVVRRQSFDFGKKDLKRELSPASSNGISSHVWKELGHDGTNENVKATNNRVKLKDQTTDVVNGTMRRSFWSKLLMCS